MQESSTTPDNNKQPSSSDLSVKTIISAFSEVDNRICSLHQCSNEDFISFNKRLKNYHLKVKEISENADTILTIIDSEQISNAFTQLNFYHYQIRIYIEDFEKQINMTISGLELLLRQINSLFLPLKNYKQNLLTFKYLVVNLKLNFAYMIHAQDEILSNELAALDNQALKMNGIYPEIEKGLESIKEFIYNLLARFKHLRDQNAMSTSMILYQTDYSLNFLNAKHADIVSQIMALRQKMTDCSECVNRIITNLQFHDIVRQKIDHIQHIQKRLLDEVAHASADTDRSIEQAIAVQIKDMAELQVAQLTHTNKKYQTAIEVIIRQFMDITENMSYVQATGRHFSGESVQEQTPFSDVEKELLEGSQTLRDMVGSIEMYYKEAPGISDSIQGINQLFEGLFTINNHFEDVVAQIISKFNKYSELEEGKKILRHLRDAGGFTKHISTLKDIVNQITTSSSQLQSFIPSQHTDADINNKLTTISQQSGQLITNLLSANKNILSIMENNSNNSTDIINDIRDAINQVKYYDFFDKTIEEIISLLNEVYFWVATSMQPQTEEEKAKHLMELHEQYTMESERLIHKSIVESNDISFENIDKAETEDDGEVEFF